MKSEVDCFQARGLATDSFCAFGANIGNGAVPRDRKLLVLVKDFWNPLVRRAFFLLLTFFAAAAGAYGGTLPPPVNLSRSVGGGHLPVIAVDAQGNIDVAWLENGVFFARSVDGGATFSHATAVQLGTVPDSLQMALAPDGNINLLWRTGPGGGHVAMFFSRSDDGGLTFSVPKNLFPPGAQSFLSQLVVDRNGHIDIAWIDDPMGGLFFIRSTDEGASFSAPVKVWSIVGEPDPQSMRSATGPAGQVYLFWTQPSSILGNCNMLLSHSLDSDVTFTSPAQLPNDPAGQCSDSPVPLVD